MSSVPDLRSRSGTFTGLMGMLLQGPVKCVAAAAPYLASGAADDLIHIYNLQVFAVGGVTVS